MLNKGPKLQVDIIDILMRFRLHEVVVIAHIRQMYRNIKLHPDDYDMQRIFWRFSPEEELQEYCLTTVTYGMKSAPFLAIRTLHQLVCDEGAEFPVASRIIRENTYMDDIVSSVRTIDEGLLLQCQLKKLLDRGGFELRKWLSNKFELLENVPSEFCILKPEFFTFQYENQPAAEILGLAWNPKKDKFSYKFDAGFGDITKRTILSEVARLFDPLGFISPVTFYGKWLIQYLWHCGLDWDDSPPEEVVAKWKQFRNELPLISKFELRRCLKVDSAIDLQLQAFADSSERGYAAVVYLRRVNSDETVATSLLIAKSKVAPIKRISLPRLELLGVVLATNLIDYARDILLPHCVISDVVVWSDSMVALQWIKSSPHRWKSFIANRVTMVQEKLSPNKFRYVPSDSNPSDIA